VHLRQAARPPSCKQDVERRVSRCSHARASVGQIATRLAMPSAIVAATDVHAGARYAAEPSTSLYARLTCVMPRFEELCGSLGRKLKRPLPVARHNLHLARNRDTIVANSK
jgi:hypothetical protein